MLTATHKVMSYAVVREFRLFNIQQCEGLPEAFSQPVVMVDDPIAATEQVTRQSAVMITHRRQNRAYYSPGRDCIIMPHPEQFTSREDYYGTLLHELTHATGHASRLNRDGITAGKHTFGDPTYSFKSWSPKWERLSCVLTLASSRSYSMTVTSHRG